MNNFDLKPLVKELLKAKEPPFVFPPPGDYHSSNTSAFFGKELCQKTYLEDPTTYKDAFRGVGKVAGLALVYGSSFKLFLDIIPGCTEQRAQELYNSFFSNLPVFTRYDKANIAAARKNGYIKTFIYRVLYIDTMNHEKWNLRAKGERQAKNLPIQGAGSEIIKYILLKLFNFMNTHKNSRWVGTFFRKEYYTRILSIHPDQVTPELISDLEAQPKGNCKILVMDGDSIIQEFDRSIQMNMTLVNKYSISVVF